MKAALVSLLVVCVSTALAETPPEVARRIIASESPPAHNPLNATVEEPDRAAAINSQLRLRHLMLTDAVSDELRICYALRLIQERRGLFSSLGAKQRNTASEQKLDRDQDILAAYLRYLNDSKK